MAITTSAVEAASEYIHGTSRPDRSTFAAGERRVQPGQVNRSLDAIGTPTRTRTEPVGSEHSHRNLRRVARGEHKTPIFPDLTLI
jgi:hypothetical protein